VLETAYPKVKDTINDALKSFRLIPRTDAGLPAAATGDGVVVVLDNMEKLTPQQRKERRVGLEKSLHGKAKETVSPGWQALQVGRFLVLNHTDEKYARRVAEHAEVIFDWLDDAFPFIGPDEYVRAPILRICKDSNEENSFRTGGGGYWFSDNQIEIVISQDNEGFVTGWAVERLNRQLLQHWFSERDREMNFAMPYWLEHGLDQVIGTARAKNKKIEFRIDDWERDGIRERLREGTFTRPRDLMKMGTEEYTSSAESFFGRAKEAGGLVRFLATGPASKSSKTRDVLRDYMRNLRLTIDEIEAEDKAKGKGKTTAPKTEKEEEEQFKASSESWKKREKRLLDSTFERSFHGWTDKEWDAFEAAYIKTVS
jgi:hypothetical protein